MMSLCDMYPASLYLISSGCLLRFAELGGSREQHEVDVRLRLLRLASEAENLRAVHCEMELETSMSLIPPQERATVLLSLALAAGSVADLNWAIKHDNGNETLRAKFLSFCCSASASERFIAVQVFSNMSKLCTPPTIAVLDCRTARFGEGKLVTSQILGTQALRSSATSYLGSRGFHRHVLNEMHEFVVKLASPLTETVDALADALVEDFEARSELDRDVLGSALNVLREILAFDGLSTEGLAGLPSAITVCTILGHELLFLLSIFVCGHAASHQIGEAIAAFSSAAKSRKAEIAAKLAAAEAEAASTAAKEKKMRHCLKKGKVNKSAQSIERDQAQGLSKLESGTGADIAVVSDVAIDKKDEQAMITELLDQVGIFRTDSCFFTPRFGVRLEPEPVAAQFVASLSYSFISKYFFKSICNSLAIFFFTVSGCGCAALSGEREHCWHTVPASCFS